MEIETGCSRNLYLQEGRDLCALGRAVASFVWPKPTVDIVIEVENTQLNVRVSGAEEWVEAPIGEDRSGDKGPRRRGWGGKVIATAEIRPDLSVVMI